MNNEKNEILENKKKGSKRTYVIAIVLALALVITITATSYAYFVANVTGTGQNTVVTTTSLEIEFTDGPQVTLENAVPGQYVEKTFKVENKGSGDTTYDVYMSDLINGFADKTDLVYTLTSNDGGYNVSSETQVPDTSSKIVNAQLLRAGEEHNYTLRIEFKETNDNQDDNKGKQFSTIIRVNEVQDALQSAVSTIQALVSGADKTSTDEIGTTGLAYDGTADNNLRYVGANPNNYVSFNNELWRIIGVMNNIETEGGQTQTLLKIRRAEALGKYSWDTTILDTTDYKYEINYGWGINQWGESGSYEGADLMRELNTDYLGNITVGTDGKWFNGDNNLKTANMPTSIINIESQSMIENVVWNLGSPNNDNGTYVDYTSDVLTTSYIYAHERGNTTGKICTSGAACNDTVIRTTSWTGKVGLFYPSDYFFATSGGSTKNRQTCLNAKILDWYNDDCSYNNWLFSYYIPTMSPYTHSEDADKVFVVNEFGSIEFMNGKNDFNINPVVFLKSSVSITGGTGTESDPYTLG